MWSHGDLEECQDWKSSYSTTPEAPETPVNGLLQESQQSKLHRFQMGKTSKGYTVKPSKHRKRNKVQNLRKKKKTKSRNKEKPEVLTVKNFRQKISNICDDLKNISTSQAIVKNKLKKDKKRLDRDMSGLCKGLKKLLNSTEKQSKDESDEECVALVENLSRNVEDLVITNENYEPGFKFTRWQQKKFQQKVSNSKIQYNHEEES